MSFQKKKGKASRIWDGLPWNSVDVSKENLGDFEDAVFFGLEELDGNAYVLSKNEQGFAVLPSSGTNEREGKKPKKVKESPQDDIFGSGETNHTNQPSKRKSLKDIRKDAMKLKEGKTSDNKVAGGKLKHQKQKQSPVGQIPFDWPLEGEADWGGVKLHVLLQKSLISLNFNFPTPIQTAAIPLATKGACDVVGAAETGSGKTLAFGLPVLDGLLRNWDQYAMPNCPYAFIIAPTRELAMQITSVLKEVCSPFKSVRRVEVVNVVGGMSEQKQRRQLCWGSTGNKQSTGPKARPVHILVATPGRLCELLQDEDIAVFRDMSSVRFLVVDEADRIVEEGHFPELHRLFGRIRDHEKLAEKGLDPAIEARRIKEGTYDFDPTEIGAAPRRNAAAAAAGTTKVAIKSENGGTTKSRSDEETLKENGHREDDEGEDEEDEGSENKAAAEGHGDDDDDDVVEMLNEDTLRQAARLGLRGLELDENGLPVFDQMPSEEELAAARRSVPAVPYDELEAEDDGDAGAGDDDQEEARERDDDENEDAAEQPTGVISDAESATRNAVPFVNKRQTLLFSATALRLDPFAKNKNFKKLSKETKAKLTGVLKDLPVHMQQLLGAVAVQSETRVVDVTGSDAVLCLAAKASEAAQQTSDPQAPEELKGNKKDKKAKDIDDKSSSKTKKRQREDEHEDEEEEQEGADRDSRDANNKGIKSIPALPKGLSQFEYRVPTEEKDVLCYYYLLKYPGRTLIFVNSIKTARRLDGLLRALEFNCRTIHAQLQQRQRLKALEAFQSAPIGVLVATDVAARGLDISKIQSVVHYDIARSPQVYIHRSGRTARANTTGTTVSLVNPEDSAHHAAICSALAAAGTSMSKVVEVVEDTAATNAPSRKKNRKGKKGDAQQQPQPKPVENVIERTPKLPALPVDLSLLPPLRERVRLAKKIFTQSFVVSKRGKEQSWLKQSAQEADLDLDEYTKEEAGDTEEQQQMDLKAKKAVEKARRDLKALLEVPVEAAKYRPTAASSAKGPNVGGGRNGGAGAFVGVSRKRSFVVVAR